MYVYSDWFKRMSYVTYQPSWSTSGGPLASRMSLVGSGPNFETMSSTIGWNPGATGYGPGDALHVAGSVPALELHAPGSAPFASIVFATLRYVSQTVGISA